MIVIIDGYNVLKQVFPHAHATLAKHRDLFIRQLTLYKSHKEQRLKKIIVVFDAGPNTHATRYVKSGIVVVFSGTNCSADDWIIEHIEKNKGHEILLVTKDRELRERGQKLGADWINVHDFYSLLIQDLSKTLANQPQQKDTALQKFTLNYADDLEEDDTNTTLLDMLMEQASITTPNKNDDGPHQEQRSHGNKTSKTERRRLAKIKKL